MGEWQKNSRIGLSHFQIQKDLGHRSFGLRSETNEEIGSNSMCEISIPNCHCTIQDCSNMLYSHPNSESFCKHGRGDMGLSE